MTSYCHCHPLDQPQPCQYFSWELFSNAWLHLLFKDGSSTLLWNSGALSTKTCAQCRTVICKFPAWKASHFTWLMWLTTFLAKRTVSAENIWTQFGAVTGGWRKLIKGCIKICIVVVKFSVHMPWWHMGEWRYRPTHY